jgi:hypothetical protein
MKSCTCLPAFLHNSDNHHLHFHCHIKLPPYNKYEATPFLIIKTDYNSSALVLWVVMPCGLEGRYQCFRGTGLKTKVARSSRTNLMSIITSFCCYKNPPSKFSEFNITHLTRIFNTEKSPLFRFHHVQYTLVPSLNKTQISSAPAQ